MAQASDGSAPWHRRAGRAVKRFWRTGNPRVAILRDVLVAGAVIGMLLLSVWAYTGQPFPSQAPLVVVESGSMMHGPARSGNLGDPTPWGPPAFGRVGTIDPGDLVFVKRTHGADDVETAFASGSRSGYGGHGDVIVFRPFGQDGTPIIHRAMLRVDAQPEGCTPGADCVYRVPEACDASFARWVVQSETPLATLCSGTSQPITLRLERDGLQLAMREYPCASGCGPFFTSFLTRGDNNAFSDQNAHGTLCTQPRSGCNSSPVRAEWIIGKARGEIPWFGLIKLAIYGNPNYKPATDPTGSTNWKVFRAEAPWDIWMALFIAIGVVVLTPVAIDLVRNRWAARREQRPPMGRPPMGRPPS